MRAPRTQSVLKRICRFAGGSHSRAVVCSLALALFLLAAKRARQGDEEKSAKKSEKSIPMLLSYHLPRSAHDRRKREEEKNCTCLLLCCEARPAEA